jgi:hypothetical protein
MPEQAASLGPGGPPDFIGVGCRHSGTAWWMNLLAQHPGVEPPVGGARELHFFSRFCTRAMTDADVAAYHAHFPRRPGVLRGEWTPRYVYDAWTPLLLQRVAPAAKLLMLVSDPVERYRTRLALERSRTDPDAEQLFMADAAGRGRYALQLRSLLPYFPRERILVLQYERCQADRAGEYARTLRFLGLQDDFRPLQVRAATEGGLVRARRALWLLRRRVASTLRGGGEKPGGAPLWPDLAAALRADLEPDVLELQAMVPELDLSLWPNFADLAATRPRARGRAAVPA